MLAAILTRSQMKFILFAAIVAVALAGWDEEDNLPLPPRQGYNSIYVPKSRERRNIVETFRFRVMQKNGFVFCWIVLFLPSPFDGSGKIVRFQFGRRGGGLKVVMHRGSVYATASGTLLVRHNCPAPLFWLTNRGDGRMTSTDL